MPTNPYVHTNSPGVRNQQKIIEGLNRQAISFAGVDMYYIPRDIISEDFLFSEDIQSQFNEAYLIEMYIESIEGFEGQELLQKFGVEIRDEVTVSMNKQRFEEMIHSTPHAALKRPREGDLVFIPFSKSLYEIMFVEHEEPFYQGAIAPNYKLRMQLFEYSGEDFETDVEGLDVMQEDQSKPLEADGYLYKLTLDSAGDWTLHENVTQATSGVTVTGEIVRIEDEGATVYVAHVTNDESDNSYRVFVSSETITGATSGVTKTVTAVTTDQDDFAQNEQIETSADSIIDSTEANVFGFDV